MKGLTGLLLTLMAAQLWAAHGILQTADGKKLEGEIQLESGAFVVTDTNSTATRVELQQLAQLKMAPAVQPGNSTSNLSLPGIYFTNNDRAGSSPLPATNAAGRVVVPAHGLLGMYFHDAGLTGDFQVRYDPTVDFNWGDATPLPGLGPGKFSVRWTGKIMPKFSEHYSFHTASCDGVRLWVNNRLMIDAWKEEFLSLASIPMVLMAGEKYDLRMEMFNTRGQALARLSWSSPSTPLSLVPSNQLVPAAVPVAPSASVPKPRLPPGVMLVNGSLLARKISSADDTSVSLSQPGQEWVLSTVNAARFLLKPLPIELASELRPGRVGLLLSNNDFVDGEFKSFADRKIKLSSVLFGVQSYDASQALVVVLRDLKPTTSRYELRTRDESHLLANSIRIEKNGITVEDAALAGLRIPAADLVQIQTSAK